MAPLVAAYAGSAPTTARAPSDERKTTQLPLDRIGSSCCTRKKGARTLTANSLSKSSTVVSSIVTAFETPALATRISRRSPTMLRAVSQACAIRRPPYIGGDGVSAAAGFVDLGDDTVGFSRATAVMDENLRTGRSKREGAGATDAARGAGDEGGFSGEVGHDRLLCCLLDLDTHGAQGSAVDRNVDTSRTNSSGYWW